MPFLLVYVSSATRLLSVLELAELLDQSRDDNARAGLTGALLYHDGNFIQVIEGEEPTVRALYARILSDRRHRDVTLLWEEHSAERQFPHWSMAFQNLGTTRSSLTGRFDDLFEIAEPGADGRATTARSLLRSFRESLRPGG